MPPSRFSRTQLLTAAAGLGVARLVVKPGTVLGANAGQCWLTYGRSELHVRPLIVAAALLAPIAHAQSKALLESAQLDRPDTLARAKVELADCQKARCAELDRLSL